MDRIPEPELMNEPQQALAYAQADFEGPNTMFVELFKDLLPRDLTGTVLDLGCGPADICLRIAKEFPHCHVYGVDGAANMLELGGKAAAEQSLSDRLTLIEGLLPDLELPQIPLAAIVSNSLLHHLPDPQVLWHTIHQIGQAGTVVLVMDLLRPADPEAARAIVEFYAANEPQILQEDFYNSLLAAYRQQEIEEQLSRAALDYLNVEVVSDRHLVVKGVLR